MEFVIFEAQSYCVYGIDGCQLDLSVITGWVMLLVVYSHFCSLWIIILF